MQARYGIIADPLWAALLICDLDDVQSRGMSVASLGLLGGARDITSAVGRGTEVRTDLPLARKSAAGAAT